MSILVNKESRIIVQGFTGSEGTFHANQMIEYGEILPKSGQEKKWFNSLTLSLRKRLKKIEKRK